MIFRRVQSRTLSQDKSRVTNWPTRNWLSLDILVILTLLQGNRQNWYYHLLLGHIFTFETKTIRHSWPERNRQQWYQRCPEFYFDICYFSSLTKYINDGLMYCLYSIPSYLYFIYYLVTMCIIWWYQLLSRQQLLDMNYKPLIYNNPRHSWSTASRALFCIHVHITKFQYHSHYNPYHLWYFRRRSPPFPRKYPHKYVILNINSIED